MRETLRTDERDTSLREVTGWDSPAYNHLLFFTNKLEKELAAERERADRLIAFLADDALAITYQSLAQYRQAAIDAERRK